MILKQFTRVFESISHTRGTPRRYLRFQPYDRFLLLLLRNCFITLLTVLLIVCKNLKPDKHIFKTFN